MLFKRHDFMLLRLLLLLPLQASSIHFASSECSNQTWTFTNTSPTEYSNFYLINHCPIYFWIPELTCFAHHTGLMGRYVIFVIIYLRDQYLPVTIVLVPFITDVLIHSLTVHVVLCHRIFCTRTT